MTSPGRRAPARTIHRAPPPSVTSDLRRRVRLLFALVVPLLVVGLVPQAAAADHVPADGAEVSPTVVEGNPMCPAGTVDARIESPKQGSSVTVAVPDGTATVSILSLVPEGAFSFEVTGAVASIVLVKGGDSANKYDYGGLVGGGVSHDDGLTAPRRGTRFAGVSHISFCLVPRTVTIAVDKTAIPSSLPEPGGAVTFTATLTNTSVVPVTLTALTDDVYGDLNGQGTCATGGTLAAGGTYSCTFTANVSGDAGATHTNVVTGAATDNEGRTATDTGTATVTVTDVLPTISVDKAASPTSLPEPGGPVTFSVKVTNTSGESVTVTSLTDDKFGNLAGQGTCATGSTLVAGASYSCTFTANVSGTAGATHTNVVTGAAKDNEGNTATATGTATVTVTQALPTISVDKAASPTSLPEPGGPVAFSVKVTNTSGESVTVTSLTDDKFGNLAGQGTCATGSTLAAGASYSCTFTANVTGDAGATHTNIVTGAATDSDGNTASATGTATVTITDVLPSISVDKVPNPATLPAPGGPVNFSVKVTNTSGETVTVTSLTDDKFGNLAGQGTCATGSTLAAGASYSCTFTANVTGDAGAIHTNVVTGAAKDNEGNTATDTGTASVTITAGGGGQLTPTGTECAAFVGETATDLNAIEYSVKGGKINNAAPGVFFYYTKVTAPSASFTVDILQSETHPTFSSLLAIQPGQIRLYDSSCTISSLGTITQPSAGQTSITVDGATPGQVFIVSVKYDPTSVVGQAVPTPSTIHYNFATVVNGVTVAIDPNGIDLVKK